MAATPSISILNDIVAEIENKSMTILISILSEQNGNKNFKTKALLEQEESSLIRNLSYRMISGHTNWQNPSLFTMWMGWKTKQAQSHSM